MAGPVPGPGTNDFCALWEVPIINVCHDMFYCLF